MSDADNMYLFIRVQQDLIVFNPCSSVWIFHLRHCIDIVFAVLSFESLSLGLSEVNRNIAQFYKYVIIYINIIYI